MLAKGIVLWNVDDGVRSTYKKNHLMKCRPSGSLLVAAPYG